MQNVFSCLKLAVLLPFFVFLPWVSSAQAIQEFQGVPSLPQVLSVGDKGYALLYRSEAGEEGQDIYAIRLLDTDLKARHQYILDIPVGAVALPKLEGRSSWVLPFHDQTAARLSLYRFNPQTGAQLRRDITALPDRGRGPTGAPLVSTSPEEGICIVQPFRRDTAGYTITMLDKDLKTQWSRMYFPKDLRQHTPLLVSVSKDMVALVLSDAYSLNPNTKQERHMRDLAMLGFDKASGKLLFRKPLAQDQLSLQPQHLVALADGQVVIGGLYAQPRTMRPDSVLGVFLAGYRADGSSASPALTSWAEIGSQVGNTSIEKDIYHRKASLKLHEILTTNGSDAKLVGEYTLSQPGAFLVFTYPATQSKVYAINRAFKGVSTADEQRHSYYSTIIGRQAEPYLLYTGVEGGQAYAYATVLAAGAARSTLRAGAQLEKLPDLPAYATEPPMARSENVDKMLGKLAGLQQKMASAAETVDKAINGEPAPVATQYREDQLLRIVAGPANQVVVYRYEPSRKLVRLQVQSLK